MTAGGVRSITALQMMIEGYQSYDFPMEGIWLDYYYLDSTNDFQVNAYDWENLKEYSQMLKTYGKKLITYMRAGLNSAPYVEGTYY